MKVTDTHQYLQYTSSHPTHNKQAIPYSQALRLRRINSNMEDFEASCTNLNNYLHKRGYPRTLINESINKARIKDRSDLLLPKQPTTVDPIHRIPCVITYHPNLPNIADFLKEHWPILKAGKNSAFKNQAPIIAYKRPKNIRDIILSEPFYLM